MKHTFPSIDMIFLCQIGRCSLSSGQSHRSARSHRLQAMQSDAALPFWAARASASSHPSSQPPAAYSSGTAGQRGRYVRSALSRNIIYKYRPCFKRYSHTKAGFAACNRGPDLERVKKRSKSGPLFTGAHGTRDPRVGRNKNILLYDSYPSQCF